MADEQRIQVLQQRLQTLSMIKNRLALAASMGQQYGGDRNLFEALGYPTSISYNDYLGKYLRHDMAKAIIDRPVDVTWRGDVQLVETDDDDETPLEKQWKELEREHKIKSRLVRLDKLTGLGRYGVMLLGLNDVRKKEDWEQPVISKPKLIYLKPFGEGNAKIHRWETKTASPRYGQPQIYQISVSHPDSNTTSELMVHHTRVIHIVDDTLDSEVEGTPRLEVVYNRLMDLEKLVGGSAEMFWRGARPGYAGEVDPDFQMTTEQMEELEKQIDEYENDLRRIIIPEGIKFKDLATQISDPSNHLDIQMQMISAVTGIPKRILTGSERGELSSSQDRTEWMAYVEGRRQEHAEPRIVRPLVDRLIELGILPPAKKDEQYTVQWEELFSMSEKEKIEIGKGRAEALSKYTNSPGGDYLMPPDTFFRHILQLSDDEIELINEERAQFELEEPRMTPEEEQIMEGEEDNTGDITNDENE